MGLKGVGITAFAAIILITSSLSVPPIAAQSQADGPHCYTFALGGHYDAAWCMYEREVMGYPNCVRIWTEWNEMLKGYPPGFTAVKPTDVSKECQLPPPPAHAPPAESCESTRQALDQYLSISAAKDPSVIKKLRGVLNSDSCGPPKSQPGQGVEECGKGDAGKVIFTEGDMVILTPCKAINKPCPPGYTKDKDGILCWPNYSGTPKPLNDCKLLKTCPEDEQPSKTKQKPEIIYRTEDYDFNQPFRRLCQGSFHAVGVLCAIATSPSVGGPAVCLGGGIGGADFVCDWVIPPDEGKRTVKEYQGYVPTCLDWKTGCPRR